MTTFATDRPAPPLVAARSSAESSLGWWAPGPTAPTTDPQSIEEAIHEIGQPAIFVRTANGPALTEGGSVTFGQRPPPGKVRRPPMLLRLTILPHFCSRIPGSTSWHIRISPNTLVSN